MQRKRLVGRLRENGTIVAFGRIELATTVRIDSTFYEVIRRRRPAEGAVAMLESLAASARTRIVASRSRSRASAVFGLLQKAHGLRVGRQLRQTPAGKRNRRAPLAERDTIPNELRHLKRPRN